MYDNDKDRLDYAIKNINSTIVCIKECAENEKIILGSEHFSKHYLDILSILDYTKDKYKAILSTK